jgi:hypothetical protein
VTLVGEPGPAGKARYMAILALENTETSCNHLMVSYKYESCDINGLLYYENTYSMMDQLIVTNRHFWM